MTTDEVLRALDALAVETGSLACLGCGFEHNCDIHGCAIIREAETSIRRLVTDNAALRLAVGGKALVEIEEFDGVPVARLRELVEADKGGRCVVLPCKQGDTVWFKTYKNSARDCIGIQPHKITRISTSIIVPGEFVDIGISVDQIGKCVFLSMEEANEADAKAPAENAILRV